LLYTNITTSYYYIYSDALSTAHSLGYIENLQYFSRISPPSPPAQKYQISGPTNTRTHEGGFQDGEGERGGEAGGKDSEIEHTQEFHDFLKGAASSFGLNPPPPHGTPAPSPPLNESASAHRPKVKTQISALSLPNTPSQTSVSTSWRGTEYGGRGEDGAQWGAAGETVAVLQKKIRQLKAQVLVLLIFIFGCDD